MRQETDGEGVHTVVTDPSDATLRSPAPLLVSMSEIAAFAQVKRPVVSTWRRRHPDFPAPLSENWLSREPVRAKLRTRIRRVLAMFDYPPEEEREAIDLVLKQMEIVAALWAPAAK